MKSLLALICLSLSLAIVPSTHASADLIFELGFNGGYTDNLLSDSTALSDKHSTSTFAVRYYPIGSLELSFNADHSYYAKVLNLSNVHTGATVTYIPTKAGARFSLFLTGTYGGRRYRADFNDYDNNDYSGQISAGYKLLPNFLVRTGVKVRGTAYLAYDSGDNTSLEMFGGFNWTLPYSNAFDLEFGYGSTGLNYYPNPDVLTPTIIFTTFDPRDPEGSLEDGDLHSIYISPRISRPIGNKTGLSLTFTNRVFQNSYKMVVADASVGLLSPWTGMWDGWSVTLNAKSYLVPTFVISAGAGYWEKTYIDILDGEDLPSFIPNDRVDYQRRIFISFLRPTKLGHIVLQPNLQLDYVSNQSNITSHWPNRPSKASNLYDYSGFSAAVGVSFRL